MDLFEKVLQQNGVDENSLNNLSRVKAYYAGKEKAIQEIREALKENIVLTPQDLARIKDEVFVKGFEEGKKCTTKQ